MSRTRHEPIDRLDQRYYNRRDAMEARATHHKHKNKQEKREAMYALETTKQRNTEHVINAILDRAATEGREVTRDEVLEDLRWDDKEDVTQWTATVDRLMFERLDEDVS